MASSIFRRMSLWGVAVAILALAGSFLQAPPALAQARTPTSAQLDAFRNLTPEQQRAVLEQLQKGGSTGETRDQTLEFPATTEPKPVRTDAETEAAFTAEGDARLRGGDTVLIELSIRPKGEDDLEKSIAEEKRKKELEQTAAERAATPGTPALDVRSKSTTKQRKKEIEAERLRERTPEEMAVLERVRDRIRFGNPYKLDRNGVLQLPGVSGIALAGLTEEQATRRLAADPALRDFLLRLTQLPLELQGADALRPFGYDLFTNAPTTFAPVSDAPVRGDYVLGPGDAVGVQLLGNSPSVHTLTVGRDGSIRIPELGPLSVAGMRFTEARAAIERLVSEQMIGTRAVVSMGELRAMTVFITGEAERPGSYSISGLSTITNALFASGGVSEIGSLRNIQLKRAGRLVTTLDLYDLLLRGDTRNDLRLQSGDVIFIPPVGNTVGITGEIRRPAIYELKGESSAADLLYLAGGLLPEADPRNTTIERIGDSRERQVVSVDLASPQGRATTLRSGDLVRINPVRPQYSNAVTIKGHVLRPGPVAWRAGLRLTDVLPRVEDLKPGADQHYVLIRREAGDRRVTAVSADLAQAWRAPNSPANVTLSPRDLVYVFNLEGGRELELKPLLAEMQQQAGMGAPTQTVGVGGQVKAPGRYPLEVAMTVSDLVRAGAGLDEAAYGGAAELARYEVVNGEYRQVALIDIDLGQVLAGDAAADFVLQPYDYLTIKALPQWTEQETITLGGEVRFPGKYPIKRGETLSQVLKRAGGLTDLAFTEGAVFTRESLQEREAQQLAALADRLQGDLAALALQATQGGGSSGQNAREAVSVGQTLLDGLREIEPVGRLVIDLERVVAAPGSHQDVVLKDGDRLLVPGRMQEVTVLGEVQSGTSHLWDPVLGRNDYIRLSGGTTQKADEGRIYVVRANGSVVSGGGSAWFKSNHGAIRPGDTVVVPLDAERMRPLPLWTAVTTIIYNLAVSVAAVNSF